MKQFVQCNLYLRISHYTFDECIGYPYCYHLSKPDLCQSYEGSNTECIVPLTFTTADKN